MTKPCHRKREIPPKRVGRAGHQPSKGLGKLTIRFSARDPYTGIWTAIKTSEVPGLTHYRLRMGDSGQWRDSGLLTVDQLRNQDNQFFLTSGMFGCFYVVGLDSKGRWRARSNTISQSPPESPGATEPKRFLG